MKLVHVILVALLAYAGGWIGFMLGEQRLEVSDLRDSQTALLEGLSRQVDDLAQRFEAHPALARTKTDESGTSLDDGSPPSAHGSPSVAEALSGLCDVLATRARHESGMAGLDGASAPARDKAGLESWAEQLSADPNAWRDHFGWSYARTLATFGVPDRVSQEGSGVFWSYATTRGPAGRLSLRFVEGGLVEVACYDR